MGHPKKQPNEVAVSDIVHQDRELRIEDLMIRGVPREQIAIRLGIDRDEVVSDIEVVRKRWEASRLRLARARAEAIAVNEFGAFEAFEAFDRSKRNEEIVTTNYVKQVCPACGGSGKKGPRICRACLGEGELVQEVVSRKVKGQAGDASLLREFREFKKEVARLRGLGGGKNKHKVDGQMPQLHLHAEIDLDKAPIEALLDAKQAIERLKSSVRSPPIDVESILPSDKKKEKVR